MYQFYHKDFPIQFRAEHYYYCWQAQRGSFWTIKQNNCWSPSVIAETGRAVGLQNTLPHTRKNHLCFLMGVQNPHSVVQFSVHKSRERKARGQQHNQSCIFTYLAFLSNLFAQQSEDCFQKEQLRPSLEKLLHHGNSNLLVTLPQINTPGNYFRF